MLTMITEPRHAWPQAMDAAKYVAYTIWMTVVQLCVYYGPRNLGCGVRAEGPPEVAGPLHLVLR